MSTLFGACYDDANLVARRTWSGRDDGTMLTRVPALAYSTSSTKSQSFTSSLSSSTSTSRSTWTMSRAPQTGLGQRLCAYVSGGRGGADAQADGAGATPAHRRPPFLFPSLSVYFDRNSHISLSAASTSATLIASCTAT